MCAAANRQAGADAGTPAKTTLFAGRVKLAGGIDSAKIPRRAGTPAKTTLFAGRVGWLRALIPRKFPQGIFANKQ